MTYRVKRFKFYNIFSPIKIPEPIPTSEPTSTPELTPTPINLGDYRGVTIILQIDGQYTARVGENQTMVTGSTIQEIKAKIDAILDAYIPPPPIPEPRNLATILNSPGNSFTLDGEYYLDAPFTVSKDIVIRGNSLVKPRFTQTGYLIRFDGNADISGITFDALLQTAGIRLTKNVDLQSCQVKNTVKTAYVDGFDIIGASSVKVKDCYVENVYASGVAVSGSQNVTIDHVMSKNVAQIYPSGGAVYVATSTNVLVQNCDIRGITMNDGIYVGTSNAPMPGARVINNYIALDSQPGGQYMGDAIKLYTINGFMTGNRVTMNFNAYGLSDWGTNNTITDNFVIGGYYGIGLFGKSNIPLVRNKFTGFKQGAYDGGANYIIQDGLI